MDPAAIEQLLEQAHATHRGIFIVGPGKLSLIEDRLPETAFTKEGIVTASLGNCRCSSDNKAIQQFTRHARIPRNAERVALGHETVQLVLHAPPASGLRPGDVVAITPGHSSTKVDPVSFEPSPEGVLAALGYSYTHLGGLRTFNVVPIKSIKIVRDQGFGALFNIVRDLPPWASLNTLAHAEPFACCYGALKNTFVLEADGEFTYGLPPRCRLAYLGGTSRMAMINLGIVSALPESEQPMAVAISGSPAKLKILERTELITQLRRRGVRVELLDRAAPDLLEKLRKIGPFEVVFTNYPSQEIYDQAVAIIARGGNINNYAGAVDPDIGYNMKIARATRTPTLRDEARARLAFLHHPLSPTDFRRRHGPQPGGLLLLAGFAAAPDRLRGYLEALPAGQRVACAEPGLAASLRAQFPALDFTADADGRVDDAVIAEGGAAARDAYAVLEPRLQRGAAVTFADGESSIFIRSRRAHYDTRHQICGPEVPWTMTNTSEPQSEDMAIQVAKPVDLDWLVAGIAGLYHAVEMIGDVAEREPFGSFFTLVQLPELPYVRVAAADFRAKARELGGAGEAGRAAKALLEAAPELEKNGGRWSRRVEELLYAGYGVAYPLG